MLQSVLTVRSLKLGKPTGCHQFLVFNLAHPIHNKKSIVYSQVLRIKRLSSKNDTFEKHLESLRFWFDKPGYPKKPVDNQIRRVPESKAEQQFECCTMTGTGAPLVVVYHPQLHNFSNTITKLFIYLYAEEQMKEVFTPASFILFRSSYSLKNHFFCAKVYPLNREKGSSCCGKNKCETCFNILNTDTFQSFVTKKFTKLPLSLPVPCWAIDSTKLRSNSNIWKTLRVNIVFTRTFSKEYLISFLMVCRLIDFALVVLKLLMFKVCGILTSQKSSFSIFQY